ncbi:MAG: hypothetical protein V1870_05730 [Candidatus Aenigmatarchaeota archaeon]
MSAFFLWRAITPEQGTAFLKLFENNKISSAFVEALENIRVNVKDVKSFSLDYLDEGFSKSVFKAKVIDGAGKEHLFVIKKGLIPGNEFKLMQILSERELMQKPLIRKLIENVDENTYWTNLKSEAISIEEFVPGKTIKQVIKEIWDSGKGRMTGNEVVITENVGDMIFKIGDNYYSFNKIIESIGRLDAELLMKTYDGDKVYFTADSNFGNIMVYEEIIEGNKVLRAKYVDFPKTTDPPHPIEFVEKIINMQDDYRLGDTRFYDDTGAMTKVSLDFRDYSDPYYDGIVSGSDELGPSLLNSIRNDVETSSIVIRKTEIKQTLDSYLDTKYKDYNFMQRDEVLNKLPINVIDDASLFVN